MCTWALWPVSSEITTEKNRSRSCFVRGLSGCVAGRSAHLGVSEVDGGSVRCTGLRQQVGQQFKGELVDVFHASSLFFCLLAVITNDHELFATIRTS